MCLAVWTIRSECQGYVDVLTASTGALDLKGLIDVMMSVLPFSCSVDVLFVIHLNFVILHTAPFKCLENNL